MAGKIAVCASCGEQKRIAARGLCGKCYSRELRRGYIPGKLSRKFRPKSSGIPAAPPRVSTDEGPLDATFGMIIEHAKRLGAAPVVVTLPPGTPNTCYVCGRDKGSIAPQMGWWQVGQVVAVSRDSRGPEYDASRLVSYGMCSAACLAAFAQKTTEQPGPTASTSPEGARSSPSVAQSGGQG